MPKNADKSFTKKAKKFWDARQRRASGPGNSGYLLDESPASISRHRFEGEWREAIQVIQRLPRRGAALDLGCGNGVWLGALAREFESVEGWDYAPSMVGASRARMKRLGKKNATVRLGAIQKRPGRAAFDFIFVGGVIMYTPDSELQGLLRSLRRLLKPGGALLLRESCVQGGTWVREGIALRGGLLKTSAAKGPEYVAVYREAQILRAALGAVGFETFKVWPNRHYKLSDLTEDWLRRLGANENSAEWMADWIYRARWIFLYPEYFLRKFKLKNFWFYCR